MKTILITGRNGFIGQALVEELKKTEKVVSLIRRKKEGIDYSNEELIFADLARLEDIDIKKYNITLIVHLAAVIRGNPDSLLENNVKSAEFIFKIAQNLNIPVVYLSTTNVFFCNYLGAYAISKKMGEEELKKKGISYLILRVPLVISKDSPYILAAKGFYKKFNFIPLFGQQKGALQPIHVSSLVNKILILVEKGIPAKESINIVGTRIYTYRKLLEGFLNINGAKFITAPFLLLKLITSFFEKVGIRFFITQEELISINMDKIIRSDFPDTTEFVPNEEQILFS
ncbi:MAG: NAD(P)-dependent oxidoreductase [Candidatus Omnitrophica bacterium]|jgi:NADH dehydrogenase|nr:NAD(P)-dependent oxidoreductase [Candidatus Omnitrophota bacterium]